MSGTMSNSNSLSPAAEADWIRKYRTQRRKCDEETGVLRNIIKRAKADGINTTEMLNAVKMTRLDSDEVVNGLRDRIRYAGLLRIDIPRDRVFDGWNETMPAVASEEDQKWEAEDQGYRAGRSGVRIDESAYPAGSPFDVVWRKGWHAGQAAIARELGPDTKVASASKARPDRTASQTPGPAVRPAKRGRKAGSSNGVSGRSSGASAGTTH